MIKLRYQPGVPVLP